MQARRRVVGVSAAVLALVLIVGGAALPATPWRARSVAAGASGSAPGDSSTLGRLELPPATAPPVQIGAVPPGDVELAPPTDQIDGEVALAPPPPELQSPFAGTVPTGGTWALVIGIDDYPGSSHDLRSAVNDALDVDLALAQMGVPADHRLRLTDGQATVGTVRTGLAWLVAHAGPDATAVVFYAGHVRRLDRDRQALVGADGRLLSDLDLAAALDPLQARRTWVAIAGCFGGGFTEVLRPGRVLTAAAGADQLAYENEGFDRSYLVEYMVRKAMIEAGATSVQAAFAWAAGQLRHDYPNRVPVEYDLAGGTVDLRPPGAPAGPPASPPARGPALAAPPPPARPSPTPAPPAAAPAPAPRPKVDGCAQLTLGVLRCTSGGT